jgi:dTDP-4-dehydrorhamnose reductase
MMGEKNAREHLAECYIVRTSAIFGVGGKNLFSRAVYLAKENNPLRIVDDQRRNPTYVKDIAQILPGLLEQDYGVYHITNSGSCTPAEFVEELVRQEGLETEVVRITRKEMNCKAERPVNSSLINTKLSPLKPWQNALREYLSEVRNEKVFN